MAGYATLNLGSAIYYMDKLYTEHIMAETFMSWWRFSEFIRVLGAAAAYLHVSWAFFSTFFPVSKEFKNFSETTAMAKHAHLMRLFLSIAIKGLNFFKIWANGDELAQAGGIMPDTTFKFVEGTNSAEGKTNLNGMVSEAGFMNYSDLDKVLEMMNFLCLFFVQPIVANAGANDLAATVYSQLVDGAYTVPDSKE